MAGLFQVLYGSENGEFKKAQTLTGTDGEPLIIPVPDENSIVENICTRPTAVDWDSDGDLDLVVGNFAGGFYLFDGEGEGKFSPTPTQIMSGDKPLKISGAHSDPFVVDWDGDGDMDILSGSTNGGVQWAENLAGPKEAPELAEFALLIEPAHHINYGDVLREKDLIGPTTATRIFVDDVNEDGKLDIFVGDNTTLIKPADGLTDEEFKQKQTEWQDEYNRLIAKMNQLPPDAEPETRSKVNQELSTMYSERSKFMTEERTGFVWLYMQK